MKRRTMKGGIYNVIIKGDGRNFVAVYVDKPSLVIAKNIMQPMTWNPHTYIYTPMPLAPFCHCTSNSINQYWNH